MNILRIAREGVFLELRSALEEAKAGKSVVARDDLRVIDQGVELSFTLRVLPVNLPGSLEISWLVLFETEAPPWTGPQVDRSPSPPPIATSSGCVANWRQAGSTCRV